MNFYSAAAISHQNIFSTPFNERMKAYQSRLSWADCSCSDLIAYLHVYVVWERNKYNNMFKTPGGERAWMKRNFLEPRVMREWKILVQEIKNRLQNIGIIEPIHGREGNFTEQEKAMMLKVSFEIHLTAIPAVGNLNTRMCHIIIS